MRKSWLTQKPLKIAPKALKRKKGINRLGKVGKANVEANKRLRVLFSDVSRCEMNLEGCLRTWLLQNAHRHKRIWYRGDVEKLSDYKQVVRACQNCHQTTENNRPLNREVFMKLRGHE